MEVPGGAAGESVVEGEGEAGKHSGGSGSSSEWEEVTHEEARHQGAAEAGAEGGEADKEGDDGEEGGGEGAEEEEEEGPELGDVFSLRKPKDFRAGLSSGAKSMAKGIFGGAAALIVAPIAGASQEGFKGFAKGVGAGLIGAVVMPVAGVAVGITQVVRGAVNQPEAIAQSRRGREWDPLKREWVEWNPDMALVMEEPPAPRGGRGADGAGGGGAGGADGEDNLYRILGVEPDATEGQIKKQYLILARKTHPDKNPGDEEASGRFQRISQAYQVLSNPALRARYDADGEAAVNEPFVDEGVFFTMLFGSDLFDDIIGELMVTTTTQSQVSELQMKRVQLARLHTLGVKLRARLKKFEDGDAEGFATEARAEASRLAKASFGPKILRLVGKTYVNAGEEGMGGLSGFGARIRGSATSMSNQVSLLKSVMSAMSAQKKLEAAALEAEARAADREEKLVAKAARAARREAKKAAAVDAAAGADPDKAEPEPDEDGDVCTDAAAATADATVGANDGAADSEEEAEEEEAEEVEEEEEAVGLTEAELQAMQEEALPAVLEAIWSTNVVDISSTVRKVCRSVLRGGVGEERVVPAAVRKARAKGLILLGGIFLEARDETEEAEASQADAHLNKEELRQKKAADAKEKFEHAMRETLKKSNE